MRFFTATHGSRFWVCLWAFCVIGLGTASTVWAQGETTLSLPDDPMTQKAKDAYNKGEYAKAGQFFRAIARRHSRNVVVYRELARSLSWADEPDYAIKAYWQYLELAPEASDREKVNAELELLLRRVKKAPSKTPPKSIRQAFEKIAERSREGAFTGKEGALGALEYILKSKHISPRIADAQETIRAGLASHSEKAVERWWALEEQTKKSSLTELVTTWELLTEQAPLNENERRMMVTLDGLTHLAMKEYPKAATLLGSVAPGHPRLRYAQALALVASKKYSQASGILQTLARGDADPRVHVLLGFAQHKAQKNAAVEHFIQALTTEEEEEDAP